jgi:DNA polymerase V
VDKQYLCIDLKSFYASVECVDRGLDPMTAKLVVADPERTDKTICLAVSPALKALGIPGRARVFEIPKGIDYIMAPPRMARYVEASAEVYAIYLRFFSKDDIHVYSIDEAFFDVTNYLSFYGCTARELGERIRQTVLDELGIPATCGLGPNLYLAKIALDITAKHSPTFFGELDVESYRATLWNHTPLTDFWRIGRGTERRLHELGIRTMGELALYPDLEVLYKVFGIDAEILFDHAWGLEPCTIADIKAYEPRAHSIVNAQVLGTGYPFEDALLIAKEMCDTSCLEMVKRGVAAESMTMHVRYDHNVIDGAGGHGTARFGEPTNARSVIMPRTVGLFERIVDREAPIHGIMLGFNNIMPEEEGSAQLSLFADEEASAEERSRQEAILDVQSKFGKNALLKGIDLMPQATQQERNRQIGGHKSGE